MADSDSSMDIEGSTAEDDQVLTQLAKIRVDHASKRASVYDAIRAIVGCDAKHCPMYYSRLPKENTTNCSILKINGKGRATPVADARTLIKIVWALGGKKARAFRVRCADYICRILGGDPALVREMEVRVEGTPREQRDFFMQNVETPAVEEIDVSNLEALRQRIMSANATLRLHKAIELLMPRAGRGVYTIVQGALSGALLGEWPRAFKSANGIAKHFNAPDFMTRPQLAAREALQETLLRELLHPGNPYINSDGIAFAEFARSEADLACRVFRNLHGEYQEPTRVADVRREYGEARGELPPAPLPPLAITYNNCVVNQYNAPHTTV